MVSVPKSMMAVRFALFPESQFSCLIPHIGLPSDGLRLNEQSTHTRTALGVTSRGAVNARNCVFSTIATYHAEFQVCNCVFGSMYICVCAKRLCTYACAQVCLQVCLHCTYRSTSPTAMLIPITVLGMLAWYGLPISNGVEAGRHVQF